MSTGVHIDFTRAIAKSARMKQAATAAMVDAVLSSTENLVPYDTGKLRQSGETESDRVKGLIIWGNSDVKYARVQYYEYPNKRLPGTVPFWYEVARARDFAKWLEKAGIAVSKVANS